MIGIDGTGAMAGRLLGVALFLALSGGAIVAQNDSATHFGYAVNGWYPCAFTFGPSPQLHVAEDDGIREKKLPFECAALRVPLCYEGVCDSADNATVDVFVKRLLAVAADEEERKRAVVLVQGGPGGSSIAMESVAERLFGELNSTTDVYTFDHRGTGRSEFLDCQAAAAMDDEGVEGGKITLEELRRCVEDLDFQYHGKASAFSVTSAAMDVRAIISSFLPSHEVHLVSFSYGTYLAQRVLQLQVPQIVGYVFDSVDARSGSRDTIQTDQSHWNDAILAPTKRFLQMCFDDPACPLRFTDRDAVVDELRALYESIDRYPTQNACSKFLQSLDETQPPSTTLRDLISHAVRLVDTRMEAIETLARIQRCSDDDAIALRAVYDDENDDTKELRAVDELSLNFVLHYLIVSSERWARPSLTASALQEEHQRGPFSVDLSQYREFYCVLTGSQDPACRDVAPAAHNATFFYHNELVNDENPTQQLPHSSSALVLSGGLDFSTPLEFSTLLYDKLCGGRGKMLVRFDYGAHCSGESTERDDSRRCYYSIVAAYVRSGGDVPSVDTSCMHDLPGLEFPQMSSFVLDRSNTRT